MDSDVSPMLKGFRRLVEFGLILPVLLSCSSAPIQNKKTPTPIPPTPLPPVAEKIDKPVNVSFSTYSKEWGVGWQWVDPEEDRVLTAHDVRTGRLRVHLYSARDLNADTQNAPRYIKAITGDFQIETRLRFNPTENFEGAGLLVYNDSNNFILFERVFGGPGGGGSGLRLDANRSGAFSPIIEPGSIQTGVPIIELRLVRAGKMFTAYWREDENGEWREAGEYISDFPDTIMTGVTVCNTAREAVAEFEYIKLLPVAK